MEKNRAPFIIIFLTSYSYHCILQKPVAKVERRRKDVTVAVAAFVLHILFLMRELLPLLKKEVTACRSREEGRKKEQGLNVAIHD